MGAMIEKILPQKEAIPQAVPIEWLANDHVIDIVYTYL